MKNRIFAIIAVISCGMLTANAAWTIGTSSNGYPYEITDGTWIIGCSVNANNEITVGCNNKNSVVAGAGNKLDLIAANNDLEGYSIVKIGQSAFSGTEINGLTIPNTVTAIEFYGFRYGVNGVVTIEDGSQLGSIGQHAFNGAPITSINLDVCKSLKTIGLEAFKDCSSLASVGGGTLPDSIEVINKGAFYNCSSWKEDVVCYARLKFDNGDTFRNTRITSLVLPNVYGAIGGYFLSGNSAITNLVLSQDITSIGAEIISRSGNVNNLENFEPKVLPKVTSIGTHFMGYAPKIKGDWEFPELVSVTGDSHFRQTKITSFKAPKLNVIPGYIFCSTSTITNAVFGSEVTSIGATAFSGCSNLESLYPTNFTKVTSLGQEAFSSCSKYTGSLDFSKSSITSIGTKAFNYASNIPELRFPASLTTLGQECFGRLKDADIYFYGSRPTTFVNGGQFWAYGAKYRNNIIIFEEYIDDWTAEDPDGKYVFTPLKEVSASEISDDYQFPKTGKVLGTIAVKGAVQWLSLFPYIPTTIIIK